MLKHNKHWYCISISWENSVQYTDYTEINSDVPLDVSYFTMKKNPQKRFLFGVIRPASLQGDQKTQSRKCIQESGIQTVILQKLST